MNESNENTKVLSDEDIDKLLGEETEELETKFEQIRQKAKRAKEVLRKLA